MIHATIVTTFSVVLVSVTIRLDDNAKLPPDNRSTKPSSIGCLSIDLSRSRMLIVVILIDVANAIAKEEEKAGL